MSTLLHRFSQASFVLNTQSSMKKLELPHDTFAWVAVSLHLSCQNASENEPVHLLDKVLFLSSLNPCAVCCPRQPENLVTLRSGFGYRTKTCRIPSHSVCRVPPSPCSLCLLRPLSCQQRSTGPRLLNNFIFDKCGGSRCPPLPLHQWCQAKSAASLGDRAENPAAGVESRRSAFPQAGQSNTCKGSFVTAIFMQACFQPRRNKSRLVVVDASHS